MDTQKLQNEKYAANISSIKEAQLRINPHIHRTPVFSSESLNSIAGRKLHFKGECFQKGGAFKFRGACNAIYSLGDDQAVKGVVTHSSGNHAAAVSLAAKLRGIPAYIIIPKNAPECKVENVKRYGGQVIWSEPTMQSRESVATKVQQETGAVLVHPFNDGRIISGQGTISLELLDQVPEIDTIIAPISGGGLISGVALAAKAINPAIKVLAAEPRGADDAAQSKAAGEIVKPQKVDTIADGLRAFLGDLTWPIVRDLVDDIITVEDKEIVEAMRMCYEILKVAVEPSGAIGLAAVLSDEFRQNPVTKDSANIGIILSGGMDMIEDMDNNEKGPGKNKRKWTIAEDKELVYALFDMVNAGTHKADNGFKPGFLGVIEAVLKQKLPGSGIKAKPHIDSRIKTMKKDFRVVYDMLNGENCSGFGWDPHKNVVVAEDEVWNAYVKTHKGASQWRSRSFPHYEMFCTIFGKDRATGKGAATTEDVLDELTRTEENEDTQNLDMDFVEMEHSTASTNNEGTSQKRKRRRSIDNMDGFREAAMIIGNKIDEATEKFSRAIGVDLDIANKRDKINEELRKLPNLSRAERHKALIVIGCDHEMTALFFTLENDEKEDFVRALLSGGL